MFRSRALLWSLIANVVLVAGVAVWGGRRILARRAVAHGRSPLVIARAEHLRALDEGHASGGSSRGSAVDVVMLGDSLTQWAEWWELFDRPVANRGVSDDTVALVQRRVPELAALRPKVVVLMIGINDLLAGTPPADVARQHAALVTSLKALLPQTRIVVQAVLPVREALLAGDDEQVSQATVAQANALLAAGARAAGAEWVDLGPLLADGSGQLAADFTSDGVHLTARAYRVWADALRSHLPPPDAR